MATEKLVSMWHAAGCNANGPIFLEASSADDERAMEDLCYREMCGAFHGPTSWTIMFIYNVSHEGAAL